MNAADGGRSPIGPILRGLGPLIQLICLALLFRPGTRTARVAGVPLEQVLYGGILLGFALVIAGLLLSRRPPRTRPRPPGSLLSED